MSDTKSIGKATPRLLEGLLGYVRHNASCRTVDISWRAGDCTCGLADLAESSNKRDKLARALAEAWLRPDMVDCIPEEIDNKARQLLKLYEQED